MMAYLPRRCGNIDLSETHPNPVRERDWIRRKAKVKRRISTSTSASASDLEQSFYICLDDKIRLDDLKPLNLAKTDLFICRDIALDDEAAANLALQYRLKTI
jgi:Mlc titration factor MtfA (ptsG expression regulator)